MNSQQRRKVLHKWLRKPENRPLVQTYLSALLMGVRPYSPDMYASLGGSLHFTLSTIADRAEHGGLARGIEVTEKGLRYMRDEI